MVFQNFIIERVPADLKEVSFYPRPSASFVKCGFCRSPENEPNTRIKFLFQLCSGNLRAPPNYWKERTSLHSEAVKAGQAPPDFRVRKEAKAIEQPESSAEKPQKNMNKPKKVRKPKEKRLVTVEIKKKTYPLKQSDLNDILQ